MQHDASSTLDKLERGVHIARLPGHLLESPWSWHQVRMGEFALVDRGK